MHFSCSGRVSFSIDEETEEAFEAEEEEGGLSMLSGRERGRQWEEEEGLCSFILKEAGKLGFLMAG